MNTCSPSDILYKSNKKFYFKCPRGIHKSGVYPLGNITGHNNAGVCRECESFAQWGIDNISEDFLSTYWDYDKNTTDPWSFKKSSNVKVWIRCQESHQHGSYTVNPNNFRNGKRCPWCAGKKTIANESFAQYLTDTYGSETFMKMWDFTNNTVSPWELPRSGIAKVNLKCPTCYAPIPARTTNHFSNKGIACRFCSGSTMEVKIAGYLTKNGYTYKREYMFDDLRDALNLRFDFAVFINNSVVLIEYQGIQHYSPVRFYGMPIEKAQQAWSDITKHDAMKHDYCNKNGYTLITIPYYSRNEYVDMLKEGLNLFA